MKVSVKDDPIVKAAKAGVSHIYSSINEQAAGFGGWGNIPQAIIRLNKEDLTKVNRLFEACKGLSLKQDDVLRMYGRRVVCDPDVTAPTLTVLS